MVSIAELINSQRSGSPVSYYAPRPYSAPRQLPGPSARYTPPRPGPSGGAVDWNAFSQANAAFQQQNPQAQPQQQGQDRGGFWGSPFGKGLGFIINNPVTRVATAPINYIQTGGRAATLGVEELAERFPKTTAIPGLGALIGQVNVERTEADPRSNWSKVFSPNTTYGYGELLNPNNPSWYNRLAGLAGDIALDPLTYVGGGATRTVAGASHLDEAMQGLQEATNLLKAARESGDAAKIAEAGQRLARAEEYVGRAPQLGRKMWEVPTPRNRAERANLMGELSETPVGRQFIEEMPGQAERGGIRGFQVMSPEAKAMLGIAEPGLRLRGFNAKIPGTGAISNRINQGGGLVRQGLANLPGGTSKIRNVRTPKGLESAYETLTRGGGGDLLEAATDVQARNVGRVGTGTQLARGNRALTRSVKEFFGDKSDEAIRKMVTEAETLPEANGVNTIAARLLGIYQDVTGRVIDPEFLKNSDTYFPHLLDPKWRRTVAKLAKRGNKSANDFLRILDTHQDDLLEDQAFYADNLMEGSGFLEKSRKLGTNEDGSPRTVDIGGVEVTFEADDVGHINEQLRKAFPEYKGDFYDTDPTRVFEAYNKSLSRQAGRDVASRRMVNVGNPLARTMTGDLDATRLAINEALAQQNTAPILSTAQGRYDPAQALPAMPERPVVPGSAEDNVRRARLEALEAAVGTTSTPKNAAVLAAATAAAPQPAPRIGGIDPNEFFRTTKGVEATAEQARQVTRAKTYAAAAAKELNVAEQTMRSGVFDLRDLVIKPLRTSISDLGQEIRTINGKIRAWAKSVKEMGPLSGDISAIKAAETQDELTAVLTRVEAEITNAETKLKRTAASWKGRATKAQRKAEAQLRQSVEDLRKVRDAARDKARAAPREIREEIEVREHVLNQPVRDANEALLRAEMEFAVLNPVPHNQAAVDSAIETLMGELDEDVDPGVLLERWRGILDDISTDAKAAGKAVATDTPEVAAKRTAYGKALERIQEIAGRSRRRGKLSKANQALLDEAIGERNELALALGQGKAVTAYDAAQARLSELRTQIDEAVAAPTSAADLTPAQIQAAVEALQRGEPMAALGKGAGIGDLPALRTERNQLNRQFGPGGRFYAEKQARDIVKNMTDWNKELEAGTSAARRGLEQAETERLMRQEAIIWKNTNKSSRYTTQFGGRPSQLEEMGRRSGQERIPESIQTPPQREGPYDIKQKQLVMGPQGPEEVDQAFPPPRTEAEAITSLKSLEVTGGPEAMSARGQARELSQELARKEAALPGEISFAQARIQLEHAVQADKELGPLADRVKTYTNLAQDIRDKRSLVAKRETARAQRESIKANPKSAWTDIGRTLDEIEGITQANPMFADPKFNQVESLLQSHRAELERIGEGRMRVADLDRVVTDAKNGKLAKVMIATLNNNWKALHSGPLNTGDIIMDADLHARFVNLFELNRQPKLLGRTFNAFTNLFKTYATLSPGFFVRNAIGGVFMNTADGVTLRAQAEGVEKWHQFMRGGEEWLDKQPQRVRDAFEAAAASGAGGRYEESGVAAKTSNALYNLISSNPATRLGQRWGTRVEGAMRMGMALDSIDKGQGVQGALQRITRVHFDYAQVSEIDETMKRIIPFWTFMSRNLPLQIQEQWTNPRVYSYYNNLVQNFSLPDEEFTPDYWSRQGAWRTPVSIGGAPLYLQPDLGFTRVQGDIEALSGALGGDNAGLLFSQANPIIGRTLDFLQKRNSFYDRTYTPEDYKKMSGPVGGPVSLLAKALGQTNEAGQVSENFFNYLTGLVPPINQVARLAPKSTGAESTPQTWVKRARYAGAPIQLLTPGAQDSEYWRQWFEMQEEQDRQRAMLEEAAS